MEVRELAKHPCRSQAVIGMVIDVIRSELPHDLVKSERGRAFGASLATHAVNDLVALLILLQHFVDGIHVILQISV